MIIVLMDDIDDDSSCPSLLDLPDHLLHFICESLDRFTVGCLSSSCKWLNHVCSTHAEELHVPSSSSLATDNTTIFPPLSFYCCMEACESALAKQPTSAASSSSCSHIKTAGKWPSIRVIVMAGSRPLISPYQFHSLLKQLSALFQFTTSFTLMGLKLTQPPPLFIIQSIPDLFPNLVKLKLVDVTIGCPASYAKWEAVGSLLNGLHLYEGSEPLPGQVDQLVVMHEARMQASGGRNVIVALELCKSLSKLKRTLKHLVLIGHKTIHLHNLALSQLSCCTKLEALEISLPWVWPFVTARSFQDLPSSLNSLTLHTSQPATYSHLLRSAVMRKRPLTCHIKSTYGGGTVYPGIMTSSSALDGGDTLYNEGLVANSLTHLPPSFSFLGPQSPFSEEPYLETSGCTPSLASLSIKSSSPDLDPLSLSNNNLSSWRERQRAEFMVVRLIVLSLNPSEIKHLDLTHVGPDMMALICSMDDGRSILNGLSLERISLGCHSNVDPSCLLALERKSSSICTPQPLSLSLRGLGGDQIHALIELTSTDDMHSISQGLACLTLAHPPHNLPLTQERGRRLTQLTELHLQRIPDLSDEDVLLLFTKCITLKSLRLSSCRFISSEVIDKLGRMRRRMRLSVAESCRLVNSKSWLEAVKQVAQLKGVVVTDVGVPRAKSAHDNTAGVSDPKASEWCTVEFGP